MTAAVDVRDLLERIEGGERHPLYLVTGELVLAEPAGVELATALAGDSSYELRRRPADLAPIVEDLRTYSLFGTGKVVLVVDSAVLADRETASALVGEAISALPVSSGEELSGSERGGALRLLQALHVFGVDPAAHEARPLLGELPDWALAGPGGRKPSKKQAESRRDSLAPLLEKARAEGLRGIGEEGIAQLSELHRRGLPAGHALVLVERSVASDHPLVERVDETGCLVSVERIRSTRRGWEGVEAVSAQLETETGVGITREALDELARRTLREEEGRGRGGGEAEAESTARLAAEYRKLAEVSRGETIVLETVERSVADRGEEDVWALLDAVGEGRGGEALSRLERLLAASEDPVRESLSFFALLASYCRHLVAVDGLLANREIPRGEGSYGRFKDRLAPRLTEGLEEGLDNPLSGVHPFRLHRSYLAASRLPSGFAETLPPRLLDTELALKGGSAEPFAALSRLVVSLSTATAGR